MLSNNLKTNINDVLPTYIDAGALPTHWICHAVVVKILQNLFSMDILKGKNVEGIYADVSRMLQALEGNL